MFDRGLVQQAESLLDTAVGGFDRVSKRASSCVDVEWLKADALACLAGALKNVATVLGHVSDMLNALQTQLQTATATPGGNAGW
jgi:hypothetical protein